MNSSSYQIFKDYIFANLSKIPSPLPERAISEQITQAKLLLEQIGIETFAKFLSVSDLISINDAEWERIQREMEQHFDVKMEKGILIQGKEQQGRDNTWWTSILKQQGANYYWNRYREYLEKSLPPDVVQTIDVDTELVMNNLENPALPSFSRYGMVVGHVQSGKTGNYSALVCKAADAGYKFIVIIAGGINNLRNQTQERLNESFIGQTNGNQVGAGIGNTDKNFTPYSLTTIERDFNKQDADRLSQGLNFDNVSVPVLLVIKKHTKTLENVITWLEKQYKNQVSQHAMLVIDDESDYASINTKEEEDPTAINKKLRKLLSLFYKSAYVAYTATPYANIFIDHMASTDDYGRDLFPKDFIYALDAPSNYFGARKIFLDTNDKHLVPIDDYESILPMNHKKDLEPDSLPDSLLEAIRLFVLNIGIRDLRGDANKHNSMLIHATRFTDVHRRLVSQVEVYVKLLKEDVGTYGGLNNGLEQSLILNDIYQTYNDYYSSDIEFDWSQIIEKLTLIIDTVIIREVHQKTSVPLEYRKDFVTNAIVIGGTSLARGYTLEGLSVSYFLRNTVFYDTLMQMGRWFGYRTGYEDLCRIYMPADRIRDFADIIRATEDLMNDFKLMSEYKRTPNDFGLAIQENPDSALQITARNKQKNVREFYYSMKLDGKAKETSELNNDKEEIDYNIRAIRNLLSKLENHPAENITNNYLWRNVNKQKVFDFLQDFKTSRAEDPLGLTARMPIAFIKKYVEERNTDWDIALYSGDGSSEFTNGKISIKSIKRQVVNKGGKFELMNRQVSSGTAESIALDKDLRKELGSDRRKTRALMKNPLLMLHIVKPDFFQKGGKILETDINITNIELLAAFGVSFPGSVLTDKDTIKLKINTVYYQNLVEELEYEMGADD